MGLRSAGYLLSRAPHRGVGSQAPGRSWVSLSLQGGQPVTVLGFLSLLSSGRRGSTLKSILGFGQTLPSIHHVPAAKPKGGDTAVPRSLDDNQPSNSLGTCPVLIQNLYYLRRFRQPLSSETWRVAHGALGPNSSWSGSHMLSSV